MDDRDYGKLCVQKGERESKFNVSPDVSDAVLLDNNTRHSKDDLLKMYQCYTLILIVVTRPLQRKLSATLNTKRAIS